LRVDVASPPSYHQRVAQRSFAPTPDEIYRRLLAEETAHVELINGEVVVHAAPGMLHSFGASAVGSDIHQAYQRGRGGPGGWWILVEVDIELRAASQAYRPDIAGWKRERVTRIPEERPVKIRPDWVCEVLSRTTASWDLGSKHDGYAAGGVPWYWVLDPEHRVLTAFELFEGGYRLAGTVTAKATGSLPPFEAVRIDMSEVFPIEGP
jgi:Uma2 family endonuclease